jgi:hypothetical protein
MWTTLPVSSPVPLPTVCPIIGDLPLVVQLEFSARPVQSADSPLIPASRGRSCLLWSFVIDSRPRWCAVIQAFTLFSRGV